MSKIRGKVRGVDYRTKSGGDATLSQLLGVRGQTSGNMEDLARVHRRGALGIKRSNGEQQAVVTLPVGNIMFDGQLFERDPDFVDGPSPFEDFENYEYHLLELMEEKAKETKNSESRDFDPAT